jgi:hypothetical protein
MRNEANHGVAEDKEEGTEDRSFFDGIYRIDMIPLHPVDPVNPVPMSFLLNAFLRVLRGSVVNFDR